MNGSEALIDGHQVDHAKARRTCAWWYRRVVRWSWTVYLAPVLGGVAMLAGYLAWDVAVAVDWPDELIELTFGDIGQIGVVLVLAALAVVSLSVPVVSFRRDTTLRRVHATVPGSTAEFLAAYPDHPESREGPSAAGPQAGQRTWAGHDPRRDDESWEESARRVGWLLDQQVGWLWVHGIELKDDATRWGNANHGVDQ